jgi:hypothetical protein
VRTCYFYTRIWDEAVAALPSGAELVYVGDTFTSYWEAIAERWGAGDLMVVEHDIVIHDQVVRQFEDCPNAWCTYPYWHGGWMDKALGCTRFRTGAQQVSPDEIQQSCWASCWECNTRNMIPSLDDMRDIRGWRDRTGSETLGCWRHIDGKIVWSMERNGYAACVHTPPVRHLTFTDIPDGELYMRSTG